MKIKTILALLLCVLMVVPYTALAADDASFTDVPEDHPYKEAIEFCALAEFVKGTGADTFRPDAQLTRGQLATIWCRILLINDQNHPFTDITRLNNYYDSPAIVMYSLGVLSGTSATKFSPNSFITREQLALITKRTFALDAADPEAYMQYADSASISTWARDAVSSCINAGIFTGLFDGEDFMPSKPVTRAEVCQLIYNLVLEEEENPPQSPEPSPSPTEEPSPSASPSEEPSPSASPTEEPSPEASPSEEPSPTPDK